MRQTIFSNITTNTKSIVVLPVLWVCFLAVNCKDDEPVTEEITTWKSIRQDKYVDLLTVDFFDENTGCITTYIDSVQKQSILYTTDGGVTFREIYNTLDTRIRKVLPIGNNSLILGTDTNYYIPDGTGDSIRMPSPYFMQSDNGGASWYPANFRHSNDIFIVSKNKFFAHTDSSLNISQDRGQTWEQVLEFNDYYAVFSFSFTSDNIGFFILLSDTYYCLKTTDGGYHWQQSAINFPDGGFQRFQFTSENTWYCLSNSSKFYKTTDKGVSWNAMSSLEINYTLFMFGANLTFHFINELEGDYFNGNEIYHTNNGGNSWTREYVTKKPAYAIIKAWSYTNTGEAYAITNAGGIIKKK